MMRNLGMIAIPLLLLVFTAKGMTQSTDAEAEVRQLYLDFVNARNTGDYEFLADQWLVPRPGSFGSNGSLRGNASESRETNRDNLRTGFENGREDNLSVRHLEVDVFGDAAIVTAYWVGTLRGTSGTVRNGPWRVTHVFVRDGNRWRQAHQHHSPLVGAPPPQ